jgi:hypothetical protein
MQLKFVGHFVISPPIFERSVEFVSFSHKKKKTSHYSAEGTRKREREREGMK